MTPEEHANVAVSKLKAAGFQVAFAHNKFIAESIRTALTDSDEFSRIEREAKERTEKIEKEAKERMRLAEAERDAARALISKLELERDTALSPAATFRERLEHLVQVVDAGQDPKDYSKLWIEIRLSKELLKSQTGKNLIERIALLEKALEEARSTGKMP